MFRAIHRQILILISCFALIRAQHHQPEIQPNPAWLYPMPWRPLILPTPNPLPQLPSVSQLSPGYTGPQTFPPAVQNQPQQQAPNTQPQQQYQNQNQQYPQPYQHQYPQQAVLVGLFTPQLQAHPLAAPPQAGHFSLPFRPSPFAGYTDEQDNDIVHEQRNSIEEQQPQQQLEQPFLHGRNAEKPQQDIGGVAPIGYVYLSPSNAYNLVRS
ncbi:gamma-gliadin [Drosophila eugracilis]|uniref:gamma-gliadin n=1 Tax=Drosophila eugracilis TaxID=29029 RepID=UPI0007E5E073|nr:gamma-gliadin [Drosophila eugracilis]